MSGSRGDRINIFKSLFEQNHIQSLYEKADLLWRQKQYEQSIKMCNKLLSIQHNHSEAHNRLATNYKAIKDKKKAIKHYQWAIIYNKLNKTAYNNLGNMYSVDKKTWNRAQACYIKCIAIDSTYSGAHANYAALLRKLGQFDDAKYHYNCAIGLSVIKCIFICFYVFCF